MKQVALSIKCFYDALLMFKQNTKLDYIVTLQNKNPSYLMLKINCT